jgi:hypothetical protein
MIGRFIIWVEDEFGHINRAFTWTGTERDGINRAKQDAIAHGKKAIDIWATPVANRNSRFVQ